MKPHKEVFEFCWYKGRPEAIHIEAVYTVDGTNIMSVTEIKDHVTMQNTVINTVMKCCSVTVIFLA